MNKTYTINGMTCEHCVNAITKEVSQIGGVNDVTVSLATGSMDVSSDAEIDFAKIADAVDEAGDYTVAKATTLDTAGHPGGECGCGGHGHHHSSDAAEKHAAHGEGECGCAHHQAEQHSHVYAADGTGEGATRSGLIGKLLNH